MTEENESEKINKYQYNSLYDSHLKGLGGLLIIVGIGVFYTLFSNLHYILTNVINNGGWLILMQPFNDLKFDEVDWVPVIEVLLYFLTTILLIQLLILFFFQKKGFSKWYIGLKLIAMIIVFLEFYLVYYELPYSKELREQVIYSTATNVLGTMIWVPYMLVSRRVRFTFVN
jgi:hypothetical protein